MDEDKKLVSVRLIPAFGVHLIRGNFFMMYTIVVKKKRRVSLVFAILLGRLVILNEVLLLKGDR